MPTRHLTTYSYAGSKTAAQFLDEGKRYLAAKEYDSALNSYSEAVALEPENYMNYFQVGG